MGHSVTGLIAKLGSLALFIRKHSLHKPIPLPQGFELLPLREEDFDSFLKQPLRGQYDGFIYMSQELVEILKDASSGVSIMYFETEYFGGVGTQGAALYTDGDLDFGPMSAEIGPINEALSIMGVSVDPPHTDAFDTIELGRYRDTEEWLEALVL